jgi:hypothetical protein
MPPRNPALPSVFERNVLQLLADQDGDHWLNYAIRARARCKNSYLKKWIDSRGLFAEFRITERGVEALRAKLP